MVTEFAGMVTAGEPTAVIAALTALYIAAKDVWKLYREFRKKYWSGG